MDDSNGERKKWVREIAYWCVPNDQRTANVCNQTNTDTRMIVSVNGRGQHQGNDRTTVEIRAERLSGEPAMSNPGRHDGRDLRHFSAHPAVCLLLMLGLFASAHSGAADSVANAKDTVVVPQVAQFPRLRRCSQTRLRWKRLGIGNGRWIP